MPAVIISGVALGYGTPQVVSLASSLASLLQMQVTILHFRDLTIRAEVDLGPLIASKAFCSIHHPFSTIGIMEYLHFVALEIDENLPELVVLTHPVHLTLLAMLRHRPKATIYYALEPIDYFTSVLRSVFDPRRIDLVIQPELHRAFRDAQALGLRDMPSIVLWNGVRNPARSPASTKEPRMVYAGTVDPVKSYAADYLDSRVCRFPIDIYGRVYPDGDTSFIDGLSRKKRKGIRYQGYHRNDADFEQLLSTYSFSIVRWSDAFPDTYYCCPNKLFQAISLGVPIVATPHPLCRTLLKRYDIGILAEDWSVAAFVGALDKACRLMGTGRHEAMVKRALAAHEDELNWDVLFARKASKPIMRLLDRSSRM